MLNTLNELNIIPSATEARPRVDSFFRVNPGRCESRAGEIGILTDVVEDGGALVLDFRITPRVTAYSPLYVYEESAVTYLPPEEILALLSARPVPSFAPTWQIVTMAIPLVFLGAALALMWS